MEDKKQLFLDAMSNVVNKRKDERQKARFDRPVDLSQNLAKGSLDSDVLPVKSSGLEDLTPAKTVVGKTDKLNTVGDVVEKTNIKDFSNKMKNLGLKQDLKATMADAIKRGDDQMIDKLKMVAKKMGKGATTGLKAFPLIGGLVAAAASGDASAAIPILGDADSVGVSPEQENMFIAEQKAKGNYLKSQAHQDKLEALKRLSGK